MVPEFQNMKMTFFRYCSYFSAFMLLKLFTNRSNLCAINFYRPFNQLVFEIWILSTFLRFIEQSIFYCVIKNVMTICLCTSALARHIMSIWIRLMAGKKFGIQTHYLVLKQICISNWYSQIICWILSSYISYWT